MYKKSGRSGGDLAGFDPERAIIKAMCNVVLKSLDEPASKKAQRTIKTFSKQRKADQNSGEDLGELG